MSKVDAMRALREAKYARGGKPPEPSAPKAAGFPAAGPPAAGPPAAGPPAAGPALCGHRNMGGKSCSRPAGHSEKSHRYAAVSPQ